MSDWGLLLGLGWSYYRNNVSSLSSCSQDETPSEFLLWHLHCLVAYLGAICVNAWLTLPQVSNRLLYSCVSGFKVICSPLGPSSNKISNVHIWQLIASTWTSCFRVFSSGNIWRHVVAQCLLQLYQCFNLICVFGHCVRDLIGDQLTLCQPRLWHPIEAVMHPQSSQWVGSFQASYLQPMRLIPQIFHT